MSLRSNFFKRISASFIMLALLMTSCSSEIPQTETVLLPSATISQNDLTIATVAISATTAIVETTETTPAEKKYNPNDPESWKFLPVIPDSVSERVKEIYRAGIENGMNPNAFSKAGDCETYTDYFLAPFDLKETGFRLGEYTSLEQVIEKYKGSFARRSIAAKQGFNVASVLSPLWADTTQCKSNEAPLICEIRLYKPSIMLIMFGTNDVNMSSADAFEKNLRQLIDFTIANNVVPVLATKADNLEGDGSINAIIARVAYEYEIPVWNLWRALQELPSGGLKEDQIHLTYAQPFFDNTENMQNGWPVRNLTALQMLEFLMIELP